MYAFRLFLSVCLATIFVAAAAPAWANTDSSVSLAPIVDLAAPYIVSILGALVAGLLGWLSKRLNDWLGVEIEGRHREVLHSAALTGLERAVSALRSRGEEVTFDLKSPVIAEAVNWVMTKGAPDAVARFGLSPADVEAIVRAKLMRVIGEV
ncbi:hypothetical protein ACDP63_16880 [Paracoccus sp. P2]|uniref:hypothetical protein n=1 Tax=Paracoccus sp. P2 TaxID=3248840 RepID=UPI00391FA9A5